MANQLSVADVQSILALHRRGWSCRAIGRALGVHRETVSRYVKQARGGEGTENSPTPGGPASAGASADPELAGASEPAKALTGSGDVGARESEPAPGPGGSPSPEPSPAASGPPEGIASSAGGASPGSSGVEDRSRPGTPSGCRPYHAVILAKLEQGLSAVRIQQDLAADHGQAAPSYHSVRRYVAQLGRAWPLPFRRMECAPGAEAQVDFGQGAPVVGVDARSGDGRPRRRRPYVLRVVLSYSRKGYSQAVFRQTTDDFLHGLEDAFWHFGGVPATLVPDNLKAAVQKADWFDPEINPKVQSFCAHYGIVLLPTRPRTPRHKGKVERGVGYVQENGLKGRQFTSLEEENRHLIHWESTVADTRIHGTTRRQVKEVFEHEEKPALRPLPPERFPCFQEARRIVHRDGHVEVAKAYYSVPPEYLGRTLWVRWDSHLVRVFDSRMQLIATHVRQDAGQFSTQNRHLLDQKISAVERGAVGLLQKAGALGPQAQRWAQAMVAARGVEGVRVLQGLVSLGRKHAHESLDRACGVALEHQCFRLRTLRQLVQRDVEPVDRQQELPGLLDEHPIIRPLADYGRFVHQAFLQPQPLPRKEIRA